MAEVRDVAVIGGGQAGLGRGISGADQIEVREAVADVNCRNLHRWALNGVGFSQVGAQGSGKVLCPAQLRP